ncbi:MAG: hypothetical protein M3470_09910 [Chloroflexota bacterium]|nr:hypothetical protein [Chloroflexota bacterium]
MYHARELARVLEEGRVDEIALQAHFEGLLYAGVSAEEKLASAQSRLVGTDSGPDTKLLMRRLLSQTETAELGGLLREWLGHREMGKTLADEARTLRNLATHRFYDKRGGERGEWHYSAEDRGQYLDGLVLEFSEAYARHVECLEPIVAAVAERWELELEPVPIEA